MPARDTHHHAVRRALEQDGWTITHDPYVIPYGRRNLYVDLGAETPLAAEKSGRRIAVEVKSFVGASEMLDLEHALGQYWFYDFLLAENEPDRTLYLALPEDAYKSALGEPAGERFVTARGLRIVVFDPMREVITQWIGQQSTQRS